MATASAATTHAVQAPTALGEIKLATQQLTTAADELKLATQQLSKARSTALIHQLVFGFFASTSLALSNHYSLVTWHRKDYDFHRHDAGSLIGFFAFSTSLAFYVITVTTLLGDNAVSRLKIENRIRELEQNSTSSSGELNSTIRKLANEHFAARLYSLLSDFLACGAIGTGTWHVAKTLQRKDFDFYSSESAVLASFFVCSAVTALYALTILTKASEDQAISQYKLRNKVNELSREVASTSSAIRNEGAKVLAHFLAIKESETK